MDEEIFYVYENFVEMGYKKSANWSICIGLSNSLVPTNIKSLPECKQRFVMLYGISKSYQVKIFT